MSKKARQMPDEHHSFIDLHRLWQQGVFTLEEAITQLLHALVRFEKRRIQLDMKMLPHRLTLEDLPTWQSYESLLAETKSRNLLEALEADQRVAYEAMDFALEQYALIELNFIQMEREWEEILRDMDDSNAHLN